MSNTLIDLTGQKFGRLTVIKYLEKAERNNKTYSWLCQCECGKQIQTCAYKLRTGHTKSCGCMKAERIGNLNRKYKHTNKRLYGVYKEMISRCYNPHNSMYKHYGGKGITVCKEWKDDFDTFAEWAFTNGYKPDAKFQECTIDRKRFDGNYEPSNCQWITNKQQAQNTSRCRFYEHNGEIHNIAEWAEILGLKYKILYRDLVDRGLTLQQAMIKRLNIIY